jgi:cephalosporin hydroxylase
MTIIGDYFPSKTKAILSPEEAKVVREFHTLYYKLWQQGLRTKDLTWFGYRLVKCPLDLWMYQELLTELRPDVIVETGTCFGGSALFLAMILDQIGHGRVITVDLETVSHRPEHPRLRYLTGSSVNPQIVGQVRDLVGNDRAFIILDSDHTADHVYQEMVAYSPFVQVGDYLIVEDTNVNGHPVWPDFGPGPMEAVDKFLAQTDEFVIDQRCERFLMTLSPRGYLRRNTVRGEATERVQRTDGRVVEPGNGGPGL